MFGKNNISPIITKTQKEIAVVKIFRTLQGEGPYVGRAAIFLRLGGCNLQCSFCDTEFDNYTLLSNKEIVKKIKQLSNNINLIVITGGEPLRQDIKPLCKLLIEENFEIQIETNGTIFRKLPKQVKVICSPKIYKKKYHITKELIEYIDAFKFLVASTGLYQEIPNIETNKPIYIQPIDEYNEEKNQKNLAYALKIALKHNYILSLQTHKILNIE